VALELKPRAQAYTANDLGVQRSAPDFFGRLATEC
jgi:hypothetical protein